MGWGHLNIFFSRTTGLILIRLDTIQPWVKRIQVFLKEGDSPSPRGDNSKRVKIHRIFFKIFSRISRPKSIKLGTNYPWVKGIQVCSNKGTGPLQRGDNNKNFKMGWGNLNMISRTTGLILTRLGTNHPRIERIQASLKEGDSPSPRGDSKIVKIHRNF